MLISLILLAILIFSIILTLTMLTNAFSGVPFVPSPNRTTPHLLKAAQLKAGETFFDLGCGDGRLIFAGMKQTPKTRGIGVENSLLPYLIARIKKFFNKSKGEIRLTNIFRTSIKEASVIFCYLMPGTMNKLREKFLEELPKGARIISLAFQIENWEPTKIFPKDKEKKISAIYVYNIDEIRKKIVNC